MLILFNQIEQLANICIINCMAHETLALPYVGTGGQEGAHLPTNSEVVKNNRTVIIAKHLCGLATDISLRSLQTFSKKDPSADICGNKDKNMTKNAHGVAIATCCHHACSWADYTGSDWLRERDISSQEFGLMKIWSSWAHTLTKKIRTAENLLDHGVTAAERADGIKDETPIVAVDEKKQEEQGDLNDDDEEEEGGGHKVDETMASSVPRPHGISLKEMSLIGCMVKRIIDQGRVAYLQALGMNAHQRRYCDRTLSPECYMIIAVHD